MGSRPGLAESIASFEAANNAPHPFVLLLAGAAYAVDALTDALDRRIAGPRPNGPAAGRRPGRRPFKGRHRHRRGRPAGEP